MYTKYTPYWRAASAKKVIDCVNNHHDNYVTRNSAIGKSALALKDNISIDDVMKPNDTYVFSFPIKAPEGAVVRNDLTAIDHLNIWLVYQRAWCEHKPSITVSVKEDEWMEVGAWVYKNFDEVSGISFLPMSDHS